jgi:hypothetical protein
MAEIILNDSKEIILGDPLSAAIRVIDSFSQKESIGEIELFLNGTSMEPVKNLSGYYLFFALPVGDNVIRVVSQYYSPADLIVAVADLDPLNPLIEISLTPRIFYPFPPSATLIQGKVINETGTPVSEAKVWLELEVDLDVTTRADSGGEFTLFFTHLKPENTVFRENSGKRYLVDLASPPAKLRVNAKKGAREGFVEDLKLEEGTTLVLPDAIEIEI